MHPLLHIFHCTTNLLHLLHQSGCLIQMITIKSQSVMKHSALLHTFNFLSHDHMHLSKGHTLLVIQFSLFSLKKHLSIIYFKGSLVRCSMMEGLWSRGSFLTIRQVGFHWGGSFQIHFTPPHSPPYASHWIQMKSLFQKLCCTWSMAVWQGHLETLCLQRESDVRVQLSTMFYNLLQLFTISHNAIPVVYTVTPKTLSILTPNAVWEVHHLTAWEFCLTLVELYRVHTLGYKIAPWVMWFGPQGVEIWSI